MAKKTATAKVTVPSKPATRVRASTSKPVKAKAAPKAKVTKVVAETKAPSKTKLARDIFTKHFGKTKREDIINMFVEQCGLTHNGANSYYGKFKPVGQKSA